MKQLIICLFLLVVIGQFVEVEVVGEPISGLLNSVSIYGGYYLGEDEESVCIRAAYFSYGGRITSLGEKLWINKPCKIITYTTTRQEEE